MKKGNFKIVSVAAIGGGPPGAAGAAAAPPYLEQDRNSVTSARCEVRSCGCGSWFCSRCCLARGIRLKERLKCELGNFTGLMMLTFTIDPELFASPAEALAYVRDHRCLSVTIQRLRRWKLLHSGRYVCVIEWQRETEQPHWHVLVDATHIPFAKLCEAWNRNWDGWQERVASGRPGFGSVRFTASRLKDSKKAAGYVTAYLTKVPEYGFPEWVVSMPVRSVHRFSTSRGFWTDRKPAGEPDIAEPNEQEQDEELEQECYSENEATSDDDSERQPVTIRERLARCGESCVVLRVRDVVDEDTGEVVQRREFLAQFPFQLFEAICALGPGEISKSGTTATYADERQVLRTLRMHLG